MVLLGRFLIRCSHFESYIINFIVNKLILKNLKKFEKSSKNDGQLQCRCNNTFNRFESRWRRSYHRRRIAWLHLVILTRKVLRLHIVDGSSNFQLSIFIGHWWYSRISTGTFNSFLIRIFWAILLHALSKIVNKNTENFKNGEFHVQEKFS